MAARTAILHFVRTNRDRFREPRWHEIEIANIVIQRRLEMAFVLILRGLGSFLIGSLCRLEMRDGRRAAPGIAGCIVPPPRSSSFPSFFSPARKSCEPRRSAKRQSLNDASTSDEIKNLCHRPKKVHLYQRTPNAPAPKDR